MGVERSGVSFWMSLRAVGDGAGILLVWFQYLLVFSSNLCSSLCRRGVSGAGVDRLILGGRKT